MMMVGTMEEERFARLNHRDSETSLDPTHFRMYSSGQGRWLSPDPLMGHPFNPQTFDRYGYALGNPARFTDPTGQDPLYCEFVTINGEFAGGGCDYTAGSNDYLNPYQEYEYNYMVYPAGCGYYNGMPVPNYPAYGGGGYTPPSQASNQYQRPNNGAAQPTHELVDVLNEQ
jgi:RHS repeat-associated protein